ncbi:hypothetical protein [Runella sp.]|uniref:hypothetical protein n=1 Tax=Runella sp. TaxID=1960881 RepID=UPI003D09E7B4
MGIKFGVAGHRTASYSLITGYSISNVILEKYSVRRNDVDLTEINNYTAFSLSIGPMIEHNRVQAGIFLGFDILSRLNQSHFGWFHQGKPWLSVGFGYSIFSNQEENKVTNPTNKL